MRPLGRAVGRDARLALTPPNHPRQASAWGKPEGRVPLQRPDASYRTRQFVLHVHSSIQASILHCISRARRQQHVAAAFALGARRSTLADDLLDRLGKDLASLREVLLADVQRRDEPDDLVHARRED